MKKFSVNYSILISFDQEEEIKGKLREALQQYFRPEFLNRLDDIIIFHRLNKEQIKKIVKIQLERLKVRLAEKHIVLEISENALEKLAEQGFDPHFGARPLKRVIQKEIENRLAVEILEGKIIPNHKILVDHNGKEFIFLIK